MNACQTQRRPDIGVSVLMCAHRNDRFLREAVDSVLQQTYSSLEIVLVANGADADAICAAYSNMDDRVHVVRSAFSGLTNNLNLGLHYCRYDLVARMDGDDIARGDRVARQVAVFEANPNVGVCGSFYQVIDPDGNLERVKVLPQNDAAIRRALKYSNPFCHPAVMYQRKLVLGAGGYLTGSHAEDFDLWLRLSADKTIEFVNIPEPLLAYRSWPTASRRNPAAYLSAMTSCLRSVLIGREVMYLMGVLAYGGRYCVAASMALARRLIFRSRVG